MNYDTNKVREGRMAVQTVELTFRLWEYSTKFILSVSGNCLGLDVIDTAVDKVFETLESHPDDSEVAVLYLKNDQGKTLECVDLDVRCEEWLKEMMVSASIISIEAYEPVCPN